MDELDAKEGPILRSGESVQQREAKLRELRLESERAVAKDTTALVNPMMIDGTLDGSTFKLRIDKDGQRLAPIGVQCPHGGGMSMPGTMAPPPPPSVEIEARDGARFTYPYATSGAAMMLSAVGRLSGDAIMEIELTCKPEP